MNNSVYKFSLDVHEATSQVVVELKQTDTAREFQISLTENGRPYVITEGCYAVFTAEKSDGTKLYHECIIDGNVIHYTTQPQTTSAVGEAFCEIQLYGANEALLISPSFTMLVHEKIFKDGDIPDSNNDFSALVNVYERTSALYDEVSQKLESGEFRGADGKDGADGKSAYEIARDNGFEGTEAEWLESLKGPQGETGFSPDIMIFEDVTQDMSGIHLKETKLQITDEEGNKETTQNLCGYSAYELAVLNGFKGTEVEWLESLVGPQGLPGENGGAANIGDGSILTDMLADGAVTQGKIAKKAVDTEQLAQFAVSADKICPYSVIEEKLAPNAVSTRTLADKAVTPEKLDRTYATPDDVKKAVGSIVIPDTEIADGSIENRHLADFSVTEDKISHGSVSGSHLQKEAVGSSNLAVGAVTDEKIKNKTITKDKMAFDVATEDFVKNSIRNISGDKPLIGDVVSIFDDFEGYEVHQVIKTTEKTKKEWKDVKIWSASDGITADSTIPSEFDFSQISETNHVEIGNLPETVDMSSLEGKSVINCVIFQDETVKKIIVVQLVEGVISIMLYDGNLNQYDIFSYTQDEGWIYNKQTATAEDLKLSAGIYPSLKIVDFASLFADNPELAPTGSDISPDYIFDILLKDVMTVYYPPGYYLTNKSEEYATKEDIEEINERLDTLVPKSWADVQRLVRSGRASQVFNVGDQLVCSKNSTAHVWDIIGFDVDTPINPNYIHSMTLQLNTTVEGRAFDDASNDYSSSDIRTYLNGDYHAGFDEEFLSVIGGVRKSDLLYNTDTESEEDDVYPGCDTFFLLSVDEVSTSPYEFYLSAEVDPTIRIKTTGASGIGIVNWWLRTSSETTSAAKIINTSGAINNGTITRTSFNIAPACVIY